MSIIDYSWDFSKEEFSLDLDFFNEKEQEDKLWQARTGLDHETLCGAIETIIFMSDRPVNLQRIKNQIDPDLPLRVVHESIARLQEEYEAKHHGIRLMEVAQGYQFRTKATYSNTIKKMFKVETLQLSPTALEVLAIIAYKQPISKTAIESIRGVDSSHIVRALMDKRLVKICGRSDEAGRPSLFGTSTEFLEVFNLNSTDDLPSEAELEELANANEIGEISDIKNIVKTGDKKRFDMDELLELDELSSSIQQIASDTSFTETLKSMDKVRKSDDGVEKKSAFDILEEFVNQSQIIEQNKASIISEVLTSVMEPQPVSLAELKTKLFNTPEVEGEFEVELELDEDVANELQVMKNETPEEFEEMPVPEFTESADDVLAKSEKLLEAMTSGDEVVVDMQASDLSDEIDAAFDELIEAVDEKVQEEVVDTSEMDLSSFISAKIAAAGQDRVAGLEETKTEEEELEEALDAAFESLTGESLSDISEEEAVDDENIEEIMPDLSELNLDSDNDSDNLEL